MATALSTLKTILGQKRYSTDTVVLDIDVEGEQALNDTLQELKGVLNSKGYPHYWDFDLRLTTIKHYIDVESYALPADFFHLQDVLSQTQNNHRFRYVTPDVSTRASARSEIGDFFGIDQRDGNTYLRLNYQHRIGHDVDLERGDNGTLWTADTTNSDALAPTTDQDWYVKHGASVNFDIDVSASGNNKATIYHDDIGSVDLSRFEDKGAIVFELDIPVVTNINSVDLVWGSDSSTTPAAKANYWSKSTVTTQANGESLVSGRNTMLMDWNGATKTASPDSSAIKYLEVTINYAAGQGDDTDFRVNNFRANNPENLNVYYYTQNVAKTSGGTYQAELAADTDLTLFSSEHDWMRNLVVEGALAKLFHIQERFDLEAKATQRFEKLLIAATRQLPSRARQPEFITLGLPNNRFRR